MTDVLNQQLAAALLVKLAKKGDKTNANFQQYLQFVRI